MRRAHRIAAIDDHLALVYLQEFDIKGQKVVVRPADWITA